MDKAFSGGLKPNIGSEGDTFERELSEGYVEFKGFAELMNTKR